MPFTEIGVPEFFASRIEIGDNNGNGTFRLLFVVDRPTPSGMIGERSRLPSQLPRSLFPPAVFRSASTKWRNDSADPLLRTPRPGVTRTTPGDIIRRRATASSPRCDAALGPPPSCERQDQ
jgi:hypothetical protein